MDRYSGFFLLLATMAAAALLAEPSPVPSECFDTLSQINRCESFVSGSVAAPAAECCNNLRAILGTPRDVCLCHVLGPELGDMLGTVIDPVRVALLPILCVTFLPPLLPVKCVGE